MPDGAAQGRFLGAFHGDRLDGVLFLGHGGLVVFAADEPHVRRLFAEEAWKDRARVRLVVGEWDQVTDVWGHLSAGGLRADRDWREVFMTVDPDDAGRRARARPAAAAREDLADLIDVSARAYREETGEDPLATMGEGYVRHVTRNIEEGRTFLVRQRGAHRVQGRDLGALPGRRADRRRLHRAGARGRGLARRGTGELARRLMRGPAPAGVPAVCLFVREDNAPARRAYERAGFVPRMFYRRLFVDPASARPRPAAGAAAARQRVTAKRIAPADSPTLTRAQ